MTEIILNCNGMSATVLPIRGALISNFSVDGNNILRLTDEFTSTGSGWPAGGIPFLFPVAGRSFSKGIAGRYNAFGKEWPMPIHGFSYGIPWTVKNRTPHQVHLELLSSETTLSLFPWHFKIDTEITLENKSLTLKTKITHLGCSEAPGTPMPVSPGFHPYFDTTPESLFNSQNLEIEFPATTVLRVSAQGGVDKQTDFPLLARYKLDHPYFANGIFPVPGPVSFKLRAAKKELKVSSPQAKYLVFWSKNNESFQCIEPWLGVPDALGFAEIGLNSKPQHPFSAQLIPENECFEFSLSLELASKP